MAREFIVPGQIITGSGALTMAEETLKGLGKKALIVTDRVMIQLGNCAKVETALKNQGIDYAIYSEIVGEPTDTMIENGLKVYKENGCDFLVALGGGSPIDSMKAIGSLVVNGGNISDYMGKVIDVEMPPLVAIPTTAGTGSEATQFTIITDTKKDIKMLLKGKVLMPKPQFTMTAPPKITAATGLDALCHAVEAYTSRKAQTLSDSFAMSAVKRIFKSLPVAFKDGKNEEARDAYKKAVAAMPEKLGVYDQRSSYTYTNLLRVSQCLNAPEAEVEAIYKEAVEKLPKEPDFDCVMGDWYWRKGQYEKAVQMYELAIAKLETYGTVNRGIITTSMLIQMYECLGEGCRRLGDYQKAVRYCVIVLNTDHKDMNALLTLINCFTESNVSAEETFQFLGKIYDYSDIKDKVILLRVAMAMGRKDLERMFRGILLPQEREEFDAAMETAQSGAPLS